MANVSINDLMAVLQKSGYQPGSSSYAMGQQEPQVQQGLQDNVVGNDQGLSYLRSKYGDQVASIAQIDQKLSGVYGDPSSPYFIKNPVKRVGYTTKAQGLGYKAAGGIASQFKSRKTDLQSQVSQGMSLFKQLKSETAATEGEKTKLDKATGKPSQVIFGQRVAKPTKGKAATGEAKKIAQSGLTNSKAIDTFLNAPPKFQATWIRHIDQHGIDSSQYTAQQMQKDIANWNKNVALPNKVETRKENQTATKIAPAPKKSNSFQSKIDQLKASLKK